MSYLYDCQVAFSKLLPHLLDYVQIIGLESTVGELYRPPEMAAIYASQGKGIKNSLHCDKLAIDLNLFSRFPGKPPEFLTNVASYETLGNYWKGLDPRCRWGGDFKHLKDGNHFSLTNDGVRA